MPMARSCSSASLLGKWLSIDIRVWSASIGNINWQTPIVVNGHIYVADNNSKFWSFPLDGIFKNGYQ